MDSFSAFIISGSNRGRNLGFPTLNLQLQDIPPNLPMGVFSCFVQFQTEEVWRMGALHHGKRPTFEDTTSCEVHIIDATIEVPPVSITVQPMQKIREVTKFANQKALIVQLQIDIDTIRALLQDNEKILQKPYQA